MVLVQIQSSSSQMDITPSARQASLTRAREAEADAVASAPWSRREVVNINKVKFMLLLLTFEFD